MSQATRRPLRLVGLALALACASQATLADGKVPWRWILPGYANASYTVAFSPDGRFVLGGGHDGTYRLWDVALDKALWQLTDGYGISVESCGDFFTDGQSLVCSGGFDGLVYVRDTYDGHVLRATPGHFDYVTAVATSPLSVYASADRDGVIKVWSEATGALLKDLHAGEYVWSLKFSHDGAYLAAAQGQTVFIWDTATWAQVRSFQTVDGDDIIGIDFSPDGTLLAGATFGNVGNADLYFWDPRGVNETRVLDTGEGRSRDVAFSPDGKRVALASGSSSVYDVATGLWLFALEGGAQGRDIEYSPAGGSIAIAGLDPAASVCDSEDGRTRVALTKQGGDITSVSFSPDSTTLVLASRNPSERRVIAWGSRNGQALYEFVRANPDQHLQASYSKAGTRMATYDVQGRLVMWDVTSRSVLWTTTLYPGKFSISPVTTRMTVANQGLRLLDSETGSSLGRFTSLGTWCRPKYSADGNFVVSGNQAGVVNTWNAADRSLVGTISAHVGEVTNVAVSTDQKLLATAGGDGFARVWDTASNQLVAEFGHSAQVTDVEFSPNGGLLLVVADGFLGNQLKFYRTKDWSLARVFDEQVGQVDDVEYSTDGALVSVAGTLTGVFDSPFVPRVSALAGR